MSVIELELDDVLVELLKSRNKPLDQAAKETIVIELYRQELLSSGKAAELLGMKRADFVHMTGRQGIPFFRMSKEEFDRETDAVRSL